MSRSTIYRRLDEDGIHRDSCYSDISDSDLDSLIVRIKIEHPYDGERLMIGHLAAHSIIVPRARVRAAIHRVDPENTALRRSVALRRRVYHADGPNSVWHLDGHHKLIRWRMVVHGGIDGYSRTVVYLKCSDNNRAYTVLSAFSSGVAFYGLPECVRTDMGGENVQVWRYMVEQHNSRNAVLVGSSTHNQRIERLWRDVFRCVGIVFYDLFTELEAEGCLDPLNETDLFCLHFVFLPQINSMLEAFCDSWNNHSMSTAGNLTPNQLFIQGALEQNMVPNLQQSNGTAAANSQLPTSSGNVEVPRIGFSPCSRLHTIISDQLSRSNNHFRDDFGRRVYKEVIHTVGNHVSRCSVCTCI